MSLYAFPAPAHLLGLFTEAISAAGGMVSDTFTDDSRLFTRAILPAVREIRGGDSLQAGVALRASEREVWVHPYVFRQVCRNGAIVAHALQTRHLQADEFETPEEASATVSEAVGVCCDDEAFADASEEMRISRGMVADVALNLLPVLARLRPEMGTQIFRMIVERFFEGEDASRYGLMNAVTSVARDTTDPEVRWHLEELGGGIPVGRPPAPETDDHLAQAAVIG